MLGQTLSAFVALSGLSAAALAQTATSPAATAQSPAPSCPQPARAGDAMALTPVSGTNLLTVPVEINRTPRQFLLDIGGGPDDISAPTVADLHLPRVDQSTASNAMADLNTPYRFGASFYNVKSAGSPMNYQARVRVASFTVAGATTQNLEFLVANDRDMGKSEPYDGIFTANLFPQYDIDFDFGEKQLSFFAATSCSDPNQVAYWPHTVVAVVPLTTSGGKMSVPVTIDGHQIVAVLDTGSDHTVMRRGFAEQTLGLGDKDMTPDGDREDGMGQQIYVHVFPKIAFGGVIAGNVPARIQANSPVHKIDRTPTLGSRASFAPDPSDRIPDLALGMDVLSQLHLYAAFAENKLYVTPTQ